MKYLPEPEDYHKYWILDIETDSLTPTVIWCTVFRNLGTDEERVAIDHEEIKSTISELDSCYFVGHNLLSFDVPILNRLLNLRISLNDCVDTLSLDYLYNPEDKHSLADIGDRFKLPKLPYHDFSKLTEEMVTYCRRDVELTKRLYLALIQKMKKVGFSEQSCELEHAIRVIINKQENNGIKFDRDGACRLRDQLLNRQTHLTTEIQRLFPPVLQKIGKTHALKLRKDGTPPLHFGRQQERFAEVRVSPDGQSYECFDYCAFNIGSPVQRVQKLLSLGWEPINFTKPSIRHPKGFPKVDEDALNEFAKKSGQPEVAAIAEWLVLQGRASMLEGWAKAARSHSEARTERLETNLARDTTEQLKPLSELINPLEINDWFIHGRVLTCGAQSRRMSHFLPNTANIPSELNGAKYGKECRQLWKARENRVLVGIDAKSCQPTLLLHYLKAPQWLQDIYLKEPGIHSYNQKGLTEGLGFEVIRGGGGAKTLYLALIFGATDKKLGLILKKKPSIGKKSRQILYSLIPGMEEFQKKAQQEFYSRDGWLRCLDGGYVRCPYASASVNYLIQPAEAVVMKRASVLVDQKVMPYFDALKVLDVHDEWQFDCRPDEAEEFGKLASQCITEAGEMYNLHVKLEGEFKIGQDWSLTH